MSDVLIRKEQGFEKRMNVHQLNDQLYRSLFEHYPDAVYALDLDGVFLSGNLMCEEIFGYRMEELANRPFFDLIDPKKREESVSHFKRVAEGESVEYETAILRKDGQSVRLSVKTFPIVVDEQIIGVYGIARDITHDLRKQAKWQESEEEYRLIAEHSSDLIAKVSPEGIVRYASPASLSLLGFLPEELQRRSIFDYLHPDDLGALSLACRTLIGEEGVITLTNRLKTKDGVYKWFETTCKSVWSGGEVREIIAIARDITPRMVAEEELRKREERYRRLVELSPYGVLICREGIIDYSNLEAMKLLGAGRAEELVGRSVFQFVHSDCHQTIHEQFRRLSCGEEVELIEQKFIRLDGRVIDVEVKGIATIHQDQPAVYVIVRDITERKRAQELLQHSEKLTLVGQLAAGIAHEIRNPLTALKGFLQLMQTGGKEKQEYFSIMSSELARIELIVSELLILAKPHSTSFQERDLATLIRHVVTLLDTEAILKKVQLHVLFETELPPIRCDENQLKQAFINFLKNGIEAMPDGGEIVIRVRRQDDCVMIRFEDSGIGIPEEQIAKLGEPFYTTKQSGTGLGLMISFRIIQNHQGKVRLMSKPGEGTTVEVTIPVCRQE
jgi:two-component system sporulation sensor kinase A